VCSRPSFNEVEISGQAMSDAMSAETAAAASW
jgi:hypothetical protein